VAENGDRRVVDWGIAAQPVAGEVESGDRALVLVNGDTALVAAVDGLGHGPQAARASEAAVETVRAYADEPVTDLAERCHRALRDGRGAALSLARISSRDDTVTWVGVGNVEGRVVRTDRSGAISVDSLVPARGIAGAELPRLRDATLPIQRGDVVLLATDGIDSGFADSLRPHGAANELAARILADHSTPQDDALVVVARYMGRNR
jgi:phosphoserine phosphatase RsbX